jgi:ferredoxin-NADP reductase
MSKIKILKFEPLNHNVRHLVTEKPKGYTFKPGQATLVSVDKEDLRDKKRPFTFTSLPEEEHLEFIIKIYPSHEGVTDEIDDLREGDHLIIEDPWGAIEFKGKGTFIAGGAGITPFVCILKDQARHQSESVNRFIFSNKKKKDLFLENELKEWTDNNLLLTFTDEAVEGAAHERVDERFLKQQIDDFNQYFYICGPEKMVEDLSAVLETLKVDKNHIVTEDL